MQNNRIISQFAMPKKGIKTQLARQKKKNSNFQFEKQKGEIQSQLHETERKLGTQRETVAKTDEQRLQVGENKRV